MSFFALGQAGARDVTNHFYFYIWFILIGLSQSIVFPVLVSVIGSWFSKSHRGLITGSWGTSSNIGNIIGIQAAALILRNNGNEWQVLMYTVTLLFGLNVILILAFFKPDPKDFGIRIEVEAEMLKM